VLVHESCLLAAKAAELRRMPSTGSEPADGDGRFVSVAGRFDRQRDVAALQPNILGQALSVT